jgi:hypothetical protein
MEHSYSVGAFVCGGACVVVKYFLELCLSGILFQIMQFSNSSWKSVSFCFAQHCYSVGQVL